MNFSDSERIASFLESRKLKRLKSPTGADLIIFNTCGVRQTAENSVMSKVHRIRKNNPDSTIAITGCLAQRQDFQRKLSGKADLFFPIKEFPLQIDKLLGTNTCERKNYLQITPQYTHQDHVWIPIMTGCNNYCSYCVVPFARGKESSRSKQEIIDEIEQAEKRGTKEVTLLGQNVNSYKIANLKFTISKFKGKSCFETTFPALLAFLAEKFPSIAFHFLTSHPKDFSIKLAEVIAGHENISKDIHLPLQSGSNRILKLMNRPYTKEDYLLLIKSIRKLIPGARFSTDVIIGFPGETQEDFKDTLDVFKRVRFYNAFLNKYSPRPGTDAYRLGDPISWEEKREREKKLRELMKKHASAQRKRKR